MCYKCLYGFLLIVLCILFYNFVPFDSWASFITAISTVIMAIATIFMAVAAWQAKNGFLNEKKFEYSIKLKNKIIETIDYLLLQTLSITEYDDSELTNKYTTLWNLIIECDSYFFALKSLFKPKNTQLIKEMISDLMLWRMCCDITNKSHMETRKNLIPKITKYKSQILEITNTEINSIIKE